MNDAKLPSLPSGTKCLTPKGPDVETYKDGGWKFPLLWARYRVHGLTVSVGWVVGHPMGTFREPNQLTIDFDSLAHAQSLDEPGEAGLDEAFEGITTSLLGSIPMAHARALMRERYEQLSVAGVRDDLMPLPARVKSDKDYLHVATAYVQLVGVSVEPIKRLAEWTEESVDTWSARLKRARAKGILEGKGRNASIGPDYVDKSNQLLAALREQKEKTGGNRNTFNRHEALAGGLADR